MKIVIDIEVELPQINKLLFCLPLRAGLIVWGYIQLILDFAYGIYICVDISNNNYYTGPMAVVIFGLMLIWTLLDGICCGYIIVGAKKSNGNYLEACYNYLRVKVPLYLGLIVIFGFMQLGYGLIYWLDRDMDGWMCILLIYQPAVGALIWVIQLYLMMLVNSMLAILGHHKDLKTLYSRLRHNATHDNLTENILQESKIEEEVKKIDDVC